jgi:antitoxin ParD1/3/4
MPDSLRQFVETQAAAGSYSASEYVRHLIRRARDEQWQKMDNFVTRNHEALNELLAVSAAELDAGKGIAWNMDSFLKECRKTHPKKKR